MGEKEASGRDLAKLYQGGATLTEIATKTGRGRFGVAYWLEKAGVARRNPGSPRKTAEEKAAFARQQLERTFGELLPKVIGDLQAGVVTAKELATKSDRNYSTFRTWLKRAGIETPTQASAPAIPQAEKADKKGKTIAILDLVSPRDSQITRQILEIFSSRHLDPRQVAAASDRQLKIFGFTDEEIVHMRKRLKKRQTGS